MWKTDLYLYLLWQVKSASIDTTVRTQYRAPSWSWASVNAEVAFALSEKKENVDHRMLCDIVDISVTPMTADETGPLRNGYLRLRGPLRRFQFEQIKRVEDYRRPQHVLNFAFEQGLRTSFFLKITMYLDNPEVHRTTSSQGKSLDLPNPQRVYLMPIVESISTHTYGTSSTQYVNVYFLVLVRGEGENDLRYYKRLGLAVAEHCNSHTYATIFFGPNSAVVEEYKDDLQAAGGYTVTIL